MALIHFNMATYVGEGGCSAANWNVSSDPATFSPSALDPDNWAESMLALGVRESVLTAKHGCGFCTWPTTAKLPDGSPYAYKVNRSTNVISRYVAAMEKAGIGHGFYYSLASNFYVTAASKGLKGPKVTAAQWQDIEIHQLSELWSNYGNLTEIWLDGGFSQSIKKALAKTFASFQPRVVAMNGGGATRNAVRWIGTEGDMGTKAGFGEVWSTYCCNGTGPCVVAHTTPCNLNSGPYGGAGCAADGEVAQDTPNHCSSWQPAGLDYTLQQGDTWFHTTPSTPLRPLSELITVYHQSVGRNTVMELDFAIAPTGQLDPSHSALYKQFGSWIRSCYGRPVSNVTLAPEKTLPVKLYTVTIDVGQVGIDRIMLSEDQSQGQRIHRYRVSSIGTNATLSVGQSVGNKRIDLLSASVTGKLRLDVLATAQGLPPRVSFKAYRPCPSS